MADIDPIADTIGRREDALARVADLEKQISRAYDLADQWEQVAMYSHSVGHTSSLTHTAAARSLRAALGDR